MFFNYFSRINLILFYFNLMRSRYLQLFDFLQRNRERPLIKFNYFFYLPIYSLPSFTFDIFSCIFFVFCHVHIDWSIEYRSLCWRQLWWWVSEAVHRAGKRRTNLKTGYQRYCQRASQKNGRSHRIQHCAVLWLRRPRKEESNQRDRNCFIFALFVWR